MSEKEIIAVKKLKKSPENEVPFAERVIIKRKDAVDNSSGYMNTKCLLPTSNDVERLFSELKSFNFRSTCVFKKNRSLWNLAQVSVVVNEISGEDDSSNDESTDDERSEDKFDVYGTDKLFGA